MIVPSSWNGQMIFLVILLMIQFIWFHLFILLPSPIFSTHHVTIGTTTTTSTLPIRQSSSSSSLSSSSSSSLPYLHLHSRQPYLYHWLDHIPEAFTKNKGDEFQQHMLKDTIWDVKSGRQQQQTTTTTTTTPITPLPITTKTTTTQQQQQQQQQPPKPQQQQQQHQPSQPKSTTLVSSSLGTTRSDDPLSLFYSRLHHSGSDSRCNDLIGSGLLQRWDSTRTTFCVPPSSPTSSSKQIEDPSLIEVKDQRLNQLYMKSFQTASSSDDDRLDDTIPFPSSSLTCRSTTNQHMPPPTAPHSFCAGSNFFLDLSTLSPSDAPRSRPHYIMGRGNHYHYSLSGSIRGQCLRTSSFNPSLISADHQRDLIDTWRNELTSKELNLWKMWLKTLQERRRSNGGGKVEPLPPPAPPTSEEPGSKELIVLTQPVLLITRENGEHCNLYHTMTDFYNSWLMVRQFKLDTKNLRVVFLDNHRPSPFDRAWESIFSRGSGGILRINKLLETGFKGSILFSSGVFVPPGYSSPIFRFYNEEDYECRSKTDLWTEFSEFFLKSMGVQYQQWSSGRETLQNKFGMNEEEVLKAVRQTIVTLEDTNLMQTTHPFIHVTVVSRQPYTNFIDHHRISRQIFNEPTLFNFVKENLRGQYTNIRLDIVDLAQINLKQQLDLIASSDILIGMHGAALTSTIFLPPWGSLVELHAVNQRVQCFKHLTEWSGHQYFPWRSTQTEREDSTGSGLDVDPIQFQNTFDQALQATREKRIRIEQEKKTIQLQT